MLLTIDRGLFQDALNVVSFRYLLYKNVPEQKLLFIRVNNNELVLSTRRMMGADVKIVIPIPKDSRATYLIPGRCWVSFVKVRNVLKSLPASVTRVVLAFDGTEFKIGSGKIRFNYPAHATPPHLMPEKPAAVVKDNVYHVDFGGKK